MNIRAWGALPGGRTTSRLQAPPHGDWAASVTSNARRHRGSPMNLGIDDDQSLLPDVTRGTAAEDAPSLLVKGKVTGIGVRSHLAQRHDFKSGVRRPCPEELPIGIVGATSPRPNASSMTASSAAEVRVARVRKCETKRRSPGKSRSTSRDDPERVLLVHAGGARPRSR